LGLRFFAGSETVFFEAPEVGLSKRLANNKNEEGKRRAAINKKRVRMLFFNYQILRL